MRGPEVIQTTQKSNDFRSLPLMDRKIAYEHAASGPVIVGDSASSWEYEDPLVRRHVELLESIRIVNTKVIVGLADEAIEDYEQLLEQHPSQPGIWFGLAGAWLEKSVTAEAAICLERAVRLRPAYAPYLYHLGMAYWSLDRTKEAADAFRKAVQIDPNYSRAFLYLAVMNFQLANPVQGKVWLDRAFKTAARQFKSRVVERGSTALMYASFAVRVFFARGNEPLTTQIARHLGAFHLRRGRYSAAEQKFRQVLDRNPHDPEGAAGLGQALLEKGRNLEALAAVQEATRHWPNDSRLMTELGIASFRRGEIDVAFEKLGCALTSDPRSARANQFMGWTLLRMEMPEKAMQYFEGCLALNPTCADAALGMSQAFQNLGDFSSSVQWLQKGIEMDPDHAGSILATVKNDKTKRNGRTLARVTKLLTKEGLPTSERVHAHFAAGIIEDELGNVDRAFEYYTAANSLKDVTCDIDAIAAAADKTIDIFTPEFLKMRRNFGIAKEGLIFIVGMPRSGSTLIEQILASHPDVTGGGELYHFPRQMQVFHKRFAPADPDPDYLVHLNKDAIHMIAIGYLEDLERLYPKNNNVTDKMLFNFWNLGVIALAFPDAKIIHTTRNPLDCCTSIYLRDFAGLHPYAYNQTNLGRYFQIYRHLMDHWTRVLPLPILEVRYEAMVAEPLATMHRLVEFCGLKWDERCQEFYKTQRPVSTSSYAQVRQPIYKSAVGKWRRYETHLQELRSIIIE